MTDPRSKTYTCSDCGAIYDGDDDHECSIADLKAALKKAKETNRLLCRDLDESQRANDILRGDL